MIQQTSLAAYDSVIDNLTAKQMLVLQELQDNPNTNEGIARGLGWPINCVTPRVLELRELGLVKHLSNVKSQKTNRMQMVWAVRQ